MAKSPRKNVPDIGIELGTACMPSELASDRATAPGPSQIESDFSICHENLSHQSVLDESGLKSEQIRNDLLLLSFISTNIDSMPGDSKSFLRI